MSAPNPKRTLAVMVAVLVLLVSTIMLWSVQAYQRSDATLGEVCLQGAILLLVLLFMVPILKSARDNVRLGLPIKDERSKKVTVLAGYYAFMVSIYLWLGIMLFEEYFTVNSAVAAAILGGSVTFAVAYVFVNRKARLD